MNLLHPLQAWRLKRYRQVTGLDKTSAERFAGITAPSGTHRRYSAQTLRFNDGSELTVRPDELYCHFSDHTTHTQKPPR